MINNYLLKEEREQGKVRGNWSNWEATQMLSITFLKEVSDEESVSNYSKGS